MNDKKTTKKRQENDNERQENDKKDPEPISLLRSMHPFPKEDAYFLGRGCILFQICMHPLVYLGDYFPESVNVRNKVFNMR
jgi:hypothetical protein